MLDPIQKVRPLLWVISMDHCFDTFAQLYPIHHGMMFNTKEEESEKPLQWSTKFQYTFYKKKLNFDNLKNKNSGDHIYPTKH
jgi:hypothetical protein